MNRTMSTCKIKRGAFIVFEGCDHSGKTTQSKRLYQYLNEHLSIPASYYVFPNRESNIGCTINAYLKNAQNLSDEAVHLLFTANRWEYQKEIKENLLKGVTVVMDRYLYSGIAYSVAKGLPYEWCMAPERGLIRPDIVFYLKVNSIDKLLSRGNFGEERYEKKEFQANVSKIFEQIYSSEQQYWRAINAESSEEEIHEHISTLTNQLLEDVNNKDLKYFR